MFYKTLMVHVDLDEGSDARVSLAAGLAKRFDAALIGISGWASNPSFSADSSVLVTAPELTDLRVMEDLLKSRGEAFRALVGKDVRQAEWRSALELPTEFVLRQACLVCGRMPSDPHHLTFTQPRALGRRVSDEFIVPVCRLHHRELHRSGHEIAWWEKLNIDPVPVALRLWQQTRANTVNPTSSSPT